MKAYNPPQQVITEEPSNRYRDENVISEAQNGETLGLGDIMSSELSPELINPRSPRIDQPIQEEPAAEEPKVILNIDSSTSLVNADFLNTVDPSCMHVDLLPSDIREDLIKK